MEKVIVIAGPTGVGKTSLSVELAKNFHGEIISGDSMQVYKEMTIGTAKITDAEKAGIPHYLVDTYSFTDDYNVKIFQDKARAYIHNMINDQHIPIICGGTGLYIKSVIYDYQFITQEQDEEYLSFLQKRSNDERWRMLKIIDPKVCESIHYNNHQRIIRALCMAHAGEKKSDIIKAQEHKPIYDAFIIGLTMDRETLYQRINLRVDEMMQTGLLDEIKDLVSKEKDVWNLQSFQGIGYKEWKGYFEGSESIEDCIEKVKKNSRNFAKRQYTWFRNQMNVHWYDVQNRNFKVQLYRDLQSWLDQ